MRCSGALLRGFRTVALRAPPWVARPAQVRFWGLRCHTCSPSENPCDRESRVEKFEGFPAVRGEGIHPAKVRTGSSRAPPHSPILTSQIGRTAAGGISALSARGSEPPPDFPDGLRPGGTFPPPSETRFGFAVGAPPPGSPPLLSRAPSLPRRVADDQLRLRLLRLRTRVGGTTYLLIIIMCIIECS